MNNNETVGIIIKVKKLWWLKINKKPIRTTSLDDTLFPSLLQVQYIVNSNEYVGKKIVFWDDSFTQVGQDVIVTYNKNKPQEILSLKKKNKQLED